MQHKGNILIETDRLILRQFALEDSTAVFSNWTSHNNVTEFLRWPTHKSKEVTEEIIRIFSLTKFDLV